MSEKIRRHTIIVTHDKLGRITGLQLEKDWWDYKFSELYPFHVLESRPQGDFVFLSTNRSITQTQAHLFTDNVIMGNIVVVDLRHYSMDAGAVRLRRARGA